MVSLRASGLSFAHSDRVGLITGADVHLDARWTGLVGGNGAGKTTLLRLVAGELAPTAGELRLEPPTALVVFCRQDVEDLDPTVRDFAASWDGVARRLQGRLRLDPADLERWPTLSPGERRRWQVGAALAAEPDVLLLDEPTNHLDAEGRDLLLGALLQFSGLGLVVSHDRAFLNALTASTLRLEAGELRLWPGAYDAARELWQAAAGAERAAYERLRKEQKKLRRRLADKRRQRQQAEGRIAHRSRMRGRHDHDATSMAAKNRVRAAEQGLGRQVAVLRRRLARSEEQARALTLRKAKGRSLSVDFEAAPRQRLLALDAPELRAAGDGPVVLRDVHLTVARDARIEIAGANGSGKSTLARALRAGSALPPERLLYLPQELTARESAALLESVRALPPDERGRVFDVVAALGVDPERLLASERLSPGEARKLLMAFGLGRRVWALVLDEPTNHLDLPSIERLEEALVDYPGALVLITHDDELARAVTDATWRLEHGRVEFG